jgi:hypothetical protein
MWQPQTTGVEKKRFLREAPDFTTGRLIAWPAQVAKAPVQGRGTSLNKKFPFVFVYLSDFQLLKMPVRNKNNPLKVIRW